MEATFDLTRAIGDITRHTEYGVSLSRGMCADSVAGGLSGELSESVTASVSHVRGISVNIPLVVVTGVAQVQAVGSGGKRRGASTGREAHSCDAPKIRDRSQGLSGTGTRHHLFNTTHLG